MRTLIDYLKELDDRAADRVFCHFLERGEGRPVTFREVLGRGFAYAESYRRRGLDQGDVVVIILKHSDDLFYAFVGAMLAGGVPTMMPPATEKQDPALYWSAQEQLFRRIGAKLLVTYPDNVPEISRLADSSATTIITPDDVPAESAERRFPQVEPDDVAFLQFSSGTTGLKKGVALRHRAVIKQIESYAQCLGIGDDDRIVSWLPLYHDMGLIACFILPLLRRIPVVMMDPFEWVCDPTSLFRAIESYRGSFVWLPNFAFNHLCQTVGPEGGHDLGSVKAFINCSEPCKSATFREFATAFASLGAGPSRLQTCYAMAETVFAVTQTEIGQRTPVVKIDPRRFAAEQRAVSSALPDAMEVLSCGRPLPGLAIKVMDEAGEQLGDDHVGEIAVSGECLFDGYFRDSEATSQVLRDGWFLTGDLGFLHHGELYVTGRKKDLIIVHGKNYYGADIEFAANRADGVKKGRCVAFGIHDQRVGSEEVVVVAESETRDKTARLALARAIKQAIAGELGLLVREVRVVPLKWLVKTTSGKLSRRENKRKFLGEKRLAYRLAS